MSTVKELREVAKNCFTGYSNMNKTQLMEAIEHYDCNRTKVDKNISILSAREFQALVQPHYWRVALYQLLKDNKFIFDPCDIGNTLKKDGQVLYGKEKDSASSTIIVLGNLKVNLKNINDQVAIKISFKSLTTDNSAMIERIVYSRITTPLIMNFNTPHTMMYMGSFVCRNFLKKLSQYPKNKISDEIAKGLMLIANTKGKAYDYNIMEILMLEQGRGQTMQDWIKTSHPWEDWQAVLFQIIYTLHCFYEVGLQQNDLHWGNVWIDKIAKTTFNYMIDKSKSTVFQFETTWFVKIYDFDLATKFATKYNSLKLTNNRLIMMESCKRAGVCNKRSKKYDTFRILWFIWAGITGFGFKQPAGVIKFIEHFISFDLLTMPMTLSGSLCRKKEKQQGCSYLKPSEKEMRSMLVMLEKGFGTYKIPIEIMHDSENLFTIPSLKPPKK